MRILAATAVLIAVSLAGCAGEASRDADGDGLYDREERLGWDIYVDLVGKRISRHVESDPDKRDTDGDGLLDQDEFFLLSDPSRADTDGDGLTDCQEVKHTVKEECEDPDYHGPFDGGYRTSASNADSDRGPSRYIQLAGYTDETGSIQSSITWGDGISDGDEVLGYEITLADGTTKTVTTSPTSVDSDGDLLEDGEEVLLYQGDPTNPDTDNDGCLDGKDAFPSRNEQYRLGLDRFRLIQGNDPGGGAQVWFQVIFAGEDVRRLPGSGTIAMSAGDTRDISGIEGGGRDVPCTSDPGMTVLTPWNPWMLVQVIPRDQDTGGSSDALDAFSSTGLGNGEIWWNVREDRFAWERGGADFEGPVHMVGDDGEVWLHPRVV